jgi:hypothetical protein
MLTIVSKKTWWTFDFPVWERVKHIVSVYNAHTSYQIKNKFSQQMKHAQRTEKYIQLIFNSYISDDDFFQKSMRIIDTTK